MSEKVRVQTSLDSSDRCSREFAVLFAQLDCPEAIAPFEGGLMRLLGSMNVVKHGKGKR